MVSARDLLGAYAPEVRLDQNGRDRPGAIAQMIDIGMAA
jgi:hypothetical protein